MNVLLDPAYHFIVTHNPSDHDNKRKYQQCNLHTRPDCNANGEVHLVFAGDCHGRRVLGCVANDGEKN